MKAKELMIGDFVRTAKDVCFSKGTIVQVRNIDADNRFLEKNLIGCATCIPIDDPDKMSWGVWVEYLEPIPLTPEILEKNGFVNDFYEDETIADNGAAITFQGYSYHDDGILVTYCNETIHATNVYTDAYIVIRGTSVSLLQHVMRLCGIDKEIQL